MLKVDNGLLIVFLSIFFFLVASYATFFSAFLSLPNIPVLRVMVEDTHYKYFAILIIPTTFYFVIANWIGWQYYSNS